MRALGRWRVGAGAALSGALLAGGLSAPVATAQAPAAAIDCPTVMAVDDVAAGMTGTGYTVSHGRTPEPFSVEVLGVMRDAILPGRDLIVVEADSPTIDRIGGIWAGMSGSPVYVGDELLGAVAWGFSWGPSKIAGITPAEDMDDLFSYPSGGAAPQRVQLSGSTARAVARRTDTEAGSGDMIRLRVPLAISGASRGLGMIREAVTREKLALIPHVASTTSAAPGVDDPLNAGDNFAAALSYGDVTAAGIGTTTMVCDGQAIAFGHPFFFEGDTMMGANQAEALAVIDDEFGPYKLANVAELKGAVDQDRFAGIRADVGSVPSTIPVTSTTNALNTGRSRDGRTDVVMHDIVPSLTFVHAYTNVDSAFDEIGEGSATITWRVTGTTASGRAWGLDRTNMYTSRWDISFASLFELLEQLYILRSNDFEDVEFTGVDLDMTVDDAIKQYKLVDLLVSRTGIAYRDVRSIRVDGGERLYLRAILEPYDGSATRKVDLTVRVPRNVRRDGTLWVRSAGDSFSEFCFYRPRRCADELGGGIESFGDLVQAMENAPTNNQVEAKLYMGRRWNVRDRDVETLDQVVAGRKRLEIDVRRHRGREGPDEG